MWGRPIPVTSATGQTINLLFVDTEGFESTGKADVYDDRIFALSTVISQILVYNLPEAIRESDLEKLSFAVELGKAFYSKGIEADEAESPVVQPGNMIWLIQRDFLEGDNPEEALATAIKPVPNPHNDPGITNLNKIREGLSLIAANSTAVGLAQPHLERTKLCELPDSQLNPQYILGRNTLRSVVNGFVRPKVVQGAPLDGAGLALLIKTVVEALNQREIPTAGSLVEYFNRDLVRACGDAYSQLLSMEILPVKEETLLERAEQAELQALEKFNKERFGATVGELREALKAALKKELDVFVTKNTYESTRVCSEVEEGCEEVLEKEATQRIPSKGRFKAHFESCLSMFHRKCVGPGFEHARERMTKTWEREYARFNKDYNEKLYNGLVIVSLAMILVCRFVITAALGESVGWIVFIFLQLYPKMFIGESSMYDAGWWQVLADWWEAVVYNKAFDMEKWGLPLGAGVLVALLTRRWWHPRAVALLRRRRLKGKQRRSRDKDLNV